MADTATAGKDITKTGSATPGPVAGEVRAPDMRHVMRNAYVRLIRRWQRWGTLLLAWTAVFWGAEAAARHLWQDETWYPFADSDASLTAWLALGGIWLAYFACWLAGSGPDPAGKAKQIRRNALFRFPGVFLFAAMMFVWMVLFALAVRSILIAWDISAAWLPFLLAGGAVLLVISALFARTAFSLPAWALNHALEDGTARQGGLRGAWLMTRRIGVPGTIRLWAILTLHIAATAAIFIAIRILLLPTPWIWTELAIHGLLTAVFYAGLLIVMILTTLAYRDARGLPIEVPAAIPPAIKKT